MAPPYSATHACTAGKTLDKGKTVTGSTTWRRTSPTRPCGSEGALKRDKQVKQRRIEDELKKLGANYIQAGLWKGFAIRDGNLVTGQQNFSGAETADVIIAALGL